MYHSLGGFVNVFGALLIRVKIKQDRLCYTYGKWYHNLASAVCCWARRVGEWILSGNYLRGRVRRTMMSVWKDKEGNAEMIFETKNCVGCRTCEIACSYHHQGVFSPSISSIKVVDRPQEQSFAISFYRQGESSHVACDGCIGLDEPLCVKYCPSIMRDELTQILTNLGHSA